MTKNNSRVVQNSLKITIGFLIIIIIWITFKMVWNINWVKMNNVAIKNSSLKSVEQIKVNLQKNTEEEKLREHCKTMPNMKWCEKFNNKLTTTKEIVSWKIEILNNNIQLWELPMDEWKVEIVFEITNTWEENVILWNADGSCFCTQWFVTNEDWSNKSPEINTIWTQWPIDLQRVITPWEKQVVTAIYDPLAHGPNVIWPTTRGLTIQTNSSMTPILQFNFSWIVVKTRSK